MSLFAAPASTRELRPYQAEAIEMLRESLRGGKRRPVLQAPTGYGKTVLAGAIIRMALERGRRVIFTAPAIDLIDQTVESFRADGIEGIGVLQADHPLTDPEQPVQVCICRVGQGQIQIGDERLALMDFAAGLRGYAAERGYKSGWAAHKYKEAVGTWPPFGAAEIEPPPVVRRWIKSRLIAWKRGYASRA